MSKEGLLEEVNDLFRSMPNLASLRNNSDETHEWIGRIKSVIGAWNTLKTSDLNANLAWINSDNRHVCEPAYRRIRIMLHEARHTLRLQTTGPLTTAFGKGMVFDHFDELRKIIETARTEVFFVDPFLDADFVPRYLSHVTPGVLVRLLGREKMSTLTPAVEAFAAQSGLPIALRAGQDFHDRYLFIDGTECYQSSASFKDGGRLTPTTLTQITDAFNAVKKTYEDIWAAAKIIR